MFIPGESFLAEAAHYDHRLFEDGMAMGVILATPTNLIALLKTVAFGWRQERIAESAKLISDQGRLLHERLHRFVKHLATLGKGLEKANDSFNSAVGSLESRVLPAARRFMELGAASGDEIQILEPIETKPRALSAPEAGDVEEEGE
jgi:DNA recombination protein RmuC